MHGLVAAARVLAATIADNRFGRRLQSSDFLPSNVGTISAGGAVGIGLAFLAILALCAVFVLMKSKNAAMPGGAPKPVVAGAGCFGALGYNLSARRTFYLITAALSVVGAAFFAAGAGSLWYGSTFIFSGLSGAFGLVTIKVCAPSLSLCNEQQTQDAALISSLVIVAAAGLFSLIRAASLAAAAGSALAPGRPRSCFAADATVFGLSIATMVIGIVGGAIPPIYLATQLDLEQYKTLVSLAGPGLVSIGVTFSTITAIVSFIMWRFVPVTGAASAGAGYAAGGVTGTPYAGNGSIISVPEGAAPVPGAAVMPMPVLGATAVPVPLYVAPGQAVAVSVAATASGAVAAPAGAVTVPPPADAAAYAAALPLDGKLAPAPAAAAVV